VSAFLVEFLSGGRWRPLSALTAAPLEAPLPAPGPGGPAAADLILPPRLFRSPGLVLVHGLAPQGKDDPELRAAARLLARLGWAVAVPTVPGLTRLTLRPEDRGPVQAAVAGLVAAGHAPVGVIGVSLGAGPALLAAAEPGSRARLSAVLTLGGYASARELLRFALTGAYGFQGLHGRRAVDEAAVARFVAANQDLVDEAGRHLVDNRDPGRVDALLAALPSRTRALLDALSPEGRVAAVTAPVFLVHGRDDPAVPYTEALRLGRATAAAGRPARVVIVGAVGHVEAGPTAAALADLWGLWAAFYAFRLTAAG
jgi:fermentation-respiration switch protein FrsA (DUF1100 family)